MIERLYTEHPAMYDEIQAGYDYERDLAVLTDLFSDLGLDGGSVLEIGCGTGEHTRRLVEAGFDVTAVDKHEGMARIARDKCDATILVDALPDLAIAGTYDAVVAIRGVVNHLAPPDLDPAIAAMADRLAPGGVLVFDNSRLPPEGNELGLDVGSTARGDYARLAQHVATDDGTLEWRSVVFGPDGEFFVNERLMSPFSDETIASVLEDAGLEWRSRDGFEPGDRRTVFIASVTTDR